MAVIDTRETEELDQKSPRMDKKVFTVAQELTLIKELSGNNKQLREKALKKVDKWILFRLQQNQISEEDFMRIWKGLFCNMWMSDKPLPQEAVADRIASMVHLPTPELSLLFFKCGLQTMCNEWVGLDNWRIDKFQMFVRRLLRNGFLILKNNKWSFKLIKVFNDALNATVLDVSSSTPLGLSLHVIDIFMEELAKISEGKLNPHLTTEFLRPFVRQYAVSKDGRQVSSIHANIFKYLLRQSDAGLEYDEKFQVWSKLGFAGGSIDAIQKVNEPDDEEDDAGEEDEPTAGEHPLDPRAGHVDVVLPQIRFVTKEIIQLFNDNMFIDGTTAKSRKGIKKLVAMFDKLSKGEYPLGVKEVPTVKDDGYSTNPTKALNRLLKFESKLKGKRKRKDDEDKTEKKKIKLDDDNVEVNKSARESKKKVASKKINKNTKEIIETINKPNGPKRKAADSTIPDGKRRKVTENYEYAFVRNSGRWFVADADKLAQTECNNTPEKAEAIVPSTEDSDKHDMIVEKLDGFGLSAVKRQSNGTASTPTPNKKVTIALKLNRSQEIHEHIKNIKNSPGIPFDANAKPPRPVLKNKISTPINPFYKF